MKILMVCLGNICRSPMAEGVLRHKINEAGLDWQVDSAGTNAYNPGCSPHHFSQKIARQHGIEICSQQCRHFNSKDMDDFDKIYVMDSDNYDDVKSLAGDKWNEKKVDYLLNEIYPSQNKTVPDPWYGGEDGYHQIYQLIEQSCTAIIKRYNNAYNHGIEPGKIV